MLEIVKDFLALEIIANFDTYFFTEYVESRELTKKIVKNPDNYEGLLHVQTTTSYAADHGTHVENEDKWQHDDATDWINYMRENNSVVKKSRPTPHAIRIPIWSREWFIEVPMYILYRVYRGLFVAFWYYLSPFVAMSLQFFFVLYYTWQKHEDAKDSQTLVEDTTTQGSTLSYLG